MNNKCLGQNNKEKKPVKLLFTDIDSLVYEIKTKRCL